MKTTLLILILYVTTLGITAQNSDNAFQPSTALTTKDKVYGLSKFWKEASYNFVFLEQIGGSKKWDSTYTALLTEVIESKNDWEYYKILQRFSAVLNDGHTNIYRPGTSLEQTGPKKEGDVYLPERNNLFEEGFISLGEVENNIIVSGVNKLLGEKIPLYSKVLRVNDMPVEEYMEKYTTPYVSESANHIRRFQSVRAITIGRYGEMLNLQYIKPDGKEDTIALTWGRAKFDFPDGTDVIFSRDKGGLSSLKWLDNGIAHLSLNSFSDKKIVEEFKEKLPELRKAKGLIIDIRYNGGGSSSIGSDILEYFVPDSVLYGSKSRTRVNIATYRAWGQMVKAKDTINNEWATKSYLVANDLSYYDLNDAHTVKVRPAISERIIVPMVILTGNFTASAAEDFLIYADKQKHMTRIGQRTWGSTGQPIMVDLGKGFGARICTKDDMYSDGRKFIGVGVVPEIEVQWTVKDYQDKIDADMKIAVEHLKKQIKN